MSRLDSRERRHSLEADEARLRALLNSVPVRVAFIDRDRRYRYVNEEYASFVGRPASEILGRSIVEVLGPEFYARLKPFGDRALAGETVRWEGWFSYPGGRERYVQPVYSPYAAPDGTIDGYFAFVRDLTDLKQHEQEVARRSAYLEAIMASALDCIVVTDEAGRVVEFNPAAEVMFGHRRAEALGRPAAELIVPPGSRDELAHCFGAGERRFLGRRIEFGAMRRDGSMLPVEIAVTEVRLEGRRLFAAYLRDLTERRRAEAEIERQREALHQAEKLTALGSLLAGVAHELNNPLSIVVGHAMLMEELSADPATAERAAKIRTAAERCGRIVKTFLAMARQRPPERTLVELNDVVAAAVDLVGYGLRSAGVEVNLDLARGLPPVDGDPDQLGQVFANLLINAEQALQDVPSPRRLTVRSALDPAARTIRLVVADNGKGIPKAVRSRVFDPFFTTKPTGSGTGLGLSLCHGIVVNHGGRISIEDTPGGGATFVIELPAADESLAAREAPVSQAAEAAPRQALIVDDEPEIADLLAEVLAQQGVASDIALNGAAAVERLMLRDYDLVLSDLRMPDLDGPGLFDWIGAERPALCDRVVFITGDRLGPAATAFLEHCGRPYIEKPFVPDEVRRTVGAVLMHAAAPHEG